MRRLLWLVLFFATTVRAAPPFMAVPTYPTGEQTAASTVLGLHCGRFVMPTTILNATKLAANVTVGYGAGGIINAMIFPDIDAAAPLAATGPLDATAAGVKVATGLPAFSLTAGLTYRACLCAETNTGGYAAPKWVVTTGFGALQNAFVASVGFASNSCGGGALAPGSTGPILADAARLPPLLMVSVE